MFQKGHKVPLEWREKYKEKLTGKSWGHHTPESKYKIAITRLGDKNVMKRKEVAERVRQKLLEGYTSGRLKPNSTCFKKGQIPYNKGMPMSNEQKLKFSIARKNAYNEGRIITWNKGKTLSLEERKKMSAYRQGIPLEKWKKFVSYEPYGEKFNRHTKEKVRKRDNYTCQYCGKPVNSSESCIHHIDYDKMNNFSMNLITLCKSCHAKTNFNRKKWYNPLLHKNAINFWKRLWSNFKSKIRCPNLLKCFTKRPILWAV